VGFDLVAGEGDVGVGVGWAGVVGEQFFELADAEVGDADCAASPGGDECLHRAPGGEEGALDACSVAW